MEIKNCTTCFFGEFEEFADTPCEACSVMGNGLTSKWLDRYVYKEDEPKQGISSVTFQFDNKYFFDIKKLLANVTVSVDYHEPNHI